MGNNPSLDGEIPDSITFTAGGVTKEINLGNVFNTFRKNYDNLKIRSACLQFIDVNFVRILRYDENLAKEDERVSGEDDPTVKAAKLKEILNLQRANRKAWFKLPREALIQILQSNKLALEDEFELFLLVKDWAAAQVNRRLMETLEKGERVDMRGSDALYGEMKEGVTKLLEDAQTKSDGESDGEEDKKVSDEKGNEEREEPADLSALQACPNQEYKIAELKKEMQPLMQYIRFPMMGSDSLKEFQLRPDRLGGFIPQELLDEALRHHALTIIAGNESSKGWYQIDRTNLRFHPRQYHTRFLWDRSWHGQHIKIEDGGRTAKKMSTGWYAIVFGDTGFTSGVHYWEIKVQSKECHIGISLKTTNGMDNYLGAQNTGWAYVYSGHTKNGNYLSYASGFNKGDKIGVRLDIPRKTLSFYKNGTALGVAFTNIPQNTRLYPAVGFRDGYNTILRGHIGSESDSSTAFTTGNGF